MPNLLLLTSHAVLLLSVIYSFARGGTPERYGAALLVGMVILQAGYRAVAPPDFYSVYPGSLVADAFGVLGFGALALYAARIWPIWATSLQILSLTSHFAEGVNPSESPGVYIALKGAPTFLVFLTLLLGALNHRRRLAKGRPVTAWRSW